MKPKTIIIGLLILVVLVFFVYPGLNGKGKDIPTPTLSIVTQPTQTYETGIICSETIDCNNYLESQGQDPTQLDLRCESSQCVYDVEGLVEVSE